MQEENSLSIVNSEAVNIGVLSCPVEVRDWVGGTTMGAIWERLEAALHGAIYLFVLVMVLSVVGLGAYLAVMACFRGASWLWRVLFSHSW